MLRKLTGVIFIFILFKITLLSLTLVDNPHELVVDGTAELGEECYSCHVSDTLLIPDSSLVCLSCHDGVNAEDRVINFPGLSSYHAISSRSVFDGAHPISVIYKEGFAGLRLKSTPIYNWNNASTINDLLRDDRIQCVSCHEPHSSVYERYLRHEEGSAICTSCHDK